MKHLPFHIASSIIVFSTTLSISPVSATVRTVNNTGGAQFTTIQSAVTAASPGDTIYICGSATAYTAPTSSKSNITFIGTGFNVQKQNPLKSTIITSPFQAGNNNRFQGLDIQAQVTFSGNFSLYFYRCNILGNMFGTSLSYVELNQCISRSGFMSGISAANAVFRNSLFFSENGNRPFSGGSFSNLLIDHCTFINETTNVIDLYQTPNIITGANISNSVFWRVTPNTGGLWTYHNNYSSASNLNDFGSNNISDASWPFISSQAAVTQTFSYAYNLDVSSSSAAYQAANNGSNMGMHGGTNPYLISGEPPIPQIDSMQIIGTQFSPGGTLNLKFYSVKGKP